MVIVVISPFFSFALTSIVFFFKLDLTVQLRLRVSNSPEVF